MESLHIIGAFDERVVSGKVKIDGLPYKPYVSNLRSPDGRASHTVKLL